jgi:hypothetical protein
MKYLVNKTNAPKCECMVEGLTTCKEPSSFVLSAFMAGRPSYVCSSHKPTGVGYGPGSYELADTENG